MGTGDAAGEQNMDFLNDLLGFVEAAVAGVFQFVRMLLFWSFEQIAAIPWGTRYHVERTRSTDITNRLAPEHLTVDAASDLDWVQNAGSVFVGRWSAQAMGDYISGPNHTLPTGGMARVRGGLSVNDFVKLITVQQYNAQAMRILGPHAALLAEAEGLTGHAEAIRTRLKRRPRD